MRQAGVVLRPEAAGQAHIDELGSTIGRDDDVGGLDVAMNHAPAGGTRQARSNGTCSAAPRRAGQTSAPLRIMRRFSPSTNFEGDEVQPLVFATRPNTMFVVEFGGAAGLLMEALARSRGRPPSPAAPGSSALRDDPQLGVAGAPLTTSPCRRRRIGSINLEMGQAPAAQRREVLIAHAPRPIHAGTGDGGLAGGMARKNGGGVVGWWGGPAENIVEAMAGSSRGAWALD